MELALLPPIILAIAEQRSLDAVLSSIATAVASQPDVGLARVWLRDTDRTCPVCAGHAPTNDEEALHLRASAGRPLDGSSDWSRIDGTFHRIPLSDPLKIAHIVEVREGGAGAVPARVERHDVLVEHPLEEPDRAGRQPAPH